MDQPQSCTKCNKLPEDILMLACSHDLCLNCAADRLNFEMKKKKPANSIVCQFCYERTPLDSESVSQLEKLIPKQSIQARGSVENSRQIDNSAKNEKIQKLYRPEEKTKEKAYQRERQPAREFSNTQSNGQGSIGNSNIQVSGISAKKSCNQHPEEEILYFCFDCKCECICPECVIHGKHKDHDVKTIRKAHPLIKAQLEACLDKIQSSIQNLLIRKSEVEKNIRSLNQNTSIAKRQIQTAFQEVRVKLAEQQRLILAKCDSNLNQSIQELEKGTKGVDKRIQELKNYSGTTIQYLKKQEMVTLNFYAKKWKQINDEARQSLIVVPEVKPWSNQKMLASILEVTDSVEKISQNYVDRRK